MEAFLMRKIQGQEQNATPLWRKKIVRFVAAASVLFLLGISVYQFKQPVSVTNAKVAATPADIAPGADKATLTLSDGSSIALDKTRKGHLTNDGIVSIGTNGQGELKYTRLVANGDKKPGAKNNISTPVGGQYRVVLPDGSKVWLNAMSSITYPTVFDGPHRKVSITGECYFEIAKDTDHPFLVEINGKQEVLVTGTHFNVNAYQNESSIRTTLIEGQVQVYQIGIAKEKESEKPVKLTPGSQSFVDPNGRLQIKKVNADAIVAWKNGFFHFQDADIAAVMRQVERWYNVEVSFENDVSEIGASRACYNTIMCICKII